MYSAYGLDKVAAYSTDEMAADAKFTNKILYVTGVVDKIVVNDIHNIYYIILTSAEKKEEWNVRCTFDRKQGARKERDGHSLPL